MPNPDIIIEPDESEAFDSLGEGSVELNEYSFSYDEESPNLVEDFENHPEGVKALKRILYDCKEMFNEAWEKNTEYRETCANNWKLLYGKHSPKVPPYEGFPNPHVPIMLQNITRLTNRIHSELFQDWKNIFQFIPMSVQSEPISPLLSEHTNWQFAHKVIGFKRNMKRALWNYAVNGESIGHSYYDEVRKTNVHEVLTCDDFCVPYTHVSVAPDFSDVPWIAKRCNIYKAKLQSMKKVWSNVDKVLAVDPDLHSLSTDTRLRDTVAEYHGEDNSLFKREEYEVIHWEGWLELPNQDRDRYCQVIFDKETDTIFKLSVHEKASYYERARVEYQTQELQQYQQELQQYQSALLRKQQMIDTLSSQISDYPQDSPVISDIVMQMKQVQESPDPPEPIKPIWMEGGKTEPDAPEKTPIYMFSHGVCLEPMLGNMGIGIGTIDADYNKAANIALALFIDAAVFSNSKTLISAGNVDFKSPFKVAPGHINKAKNVMPSDLKNAFIELDFGGANPQLMQLVQSLMSFGESATQTPEVMSGAAGKSGETARGIQSRLDQVATNLSVPAQGFGDFVIQIGLNNSKLNAIFLKDYEMFYPNRYNDQLNQQPVEMIRIARQMYDNEFEVSLNSDMQFRSRAQKISEADEMVQLPNASPLMQQNLAFIYHAIKKSLEARGMYKFSRELMGPPPPPPTTPFGLPPPPPPGMAPPQQGQPPQGAK